MITKADPLQQLFRSSVKDVTPTRLRLLLLVNCLSALTFAIVAVTTIQQHEHAVKTVGLDSAPSVMAAHQIKIGVEEMDANLADELLYKPGQQESRDMADGFEKWRIIVSKQLVAAAKNITFGKAEQTPIENIQIALGRFEMQAQAARDMHLNNPAETVNSYRAAFKTLQQELLPSADALNKANADALESAYSDAKSESGLSRGLVVVMGMALIALLIYTQIYLAMRFRRRLNVPFLIATICAIVFLHHVTVALGANSRNLKIAKEDAYNSIVALLDARANAYDADASESRWLLDSEHAAEHAKSFSDKIATVAHFSFGHDCLEAIEKAQKQLANQEKFSLPGFTGSLADELHNVRFEGEGEAAVEALQAFCNYSQTDGKMRQLAETGAHDKAVRLCLSYSPNNCKFSFTEFDDALGRALKINQDHFENAIDEAFSDLDHLILLSGAVALFIAFCAYLGLRARMAEYLT